MIYVFNSSDYPQKIAESITEESISRFGWSYIDSANLLLLCDIPREEMDEEELKIFKKTAFLLQIKRGDWIIHVNTPTYGKCIAGKVSEPYYFDKVGIEDDYRHCLTIESNSIVLFDRNDNFVHPTISRRLKLQGHYWRLYNEKEFFESKEALIANNRCEQIPNKEIYHLKKDIASVFKEITAKIHQTHPEKKLEYLLCDIFKNVPNVVEAYVNGSGWGTDYGADIVVRYNSGLDILNLQKLETLVIQVKSYEGNHNDLHCIKQLHDAIEKFGASCAMLITTANSTQALEEAINKLSTRVDKPIALMAGGDVAKFILKFENSKLIEL